jgi:hypothetical protein
MSSGQPDSILDLRLRSSEEGGRVTATPADKLACIFELGGENFECVLLLHEIGPLDPGASAVVPVAFLAPELVKPRLVQGSRFRLKDYRVIGEGRVQQILDE